LGPVIVITGHGEPENARGEAELLGLEVPPAIRSDESRSNAKNLPRDASTGFNLAVPEPSAVGLLSPEAASRPQLRPLGPSPSSSSANANPQSQHLNLSRANSPLRVWFLTPLYFSLVLILVSVLSLIRLPRYTQAEFERLQNNTDPAAFAPLDFSQGRKLYWERRGTRLFFTLMEWIVTALTSIW
jgi:hypothetical protein